MKSAIALVLLIALTAVSAQNTDATTAAQTTKGPTTKAPTTAAKTTAAPTTTAKTTAAPTTKATTTPATTTGTKEPTTTPDQTTTHTAEVTTASTTAKPVVTTPKDNHTVMFSVQEGDVVCILFKADVKMFFTYKDDSNQTNQDSMYLPTSATAKGTCNGTQSMMITYGKDNANVLTLFFAKDKTNTFIQNMSLSFTMDTTFPGINKTRQMVVTNTKPVYKGSSGLPYKCNSAINTTLQTKSDPSLTLTLNTKDLEYEAYRTKNDTVFGEKYVNCPEDSVTSNIVPIAVGAALAALVVIVLIAYLISRNRTKRGYESV